LFSLWDALYRTGTARQYLYHPHQPGSRNRSSCRGGHKTFDTVYYFINRIFERGILREVEKRQHHNGEKAGHVGTGRTCDGILVLLDYTVRSPTETLSVTTIANLPRVPHPSG
jgi:hypothetical protein